MPSERGHGQNGLSYVGVAGFFPGYQLRAGREISMEGRINGCFRCAMNGKPLKSDPDQMQAMVAYFE